MTIAGSASNIPCRGLLCDPAFLVIELVHPRCPLLNQFAAWPTLSYATNIHIVDYGEPFCFRRKCPTIFCARPIAHSVDFESAEATHRRTRTWPISGLCPYFQPERQGAARLPLAPWPPGRINSSCSSKSPFRTKSVRRASPAAISIEFVSLHFRSCPCGQWPLIAQCIVNRAHQCNADPAAFPLFFLCF